MKIARAGVRPYALPLRRPLPTARGTIPVRQGLLLTLESDDGVPGIGEAAPLPGFGGEPLAAAAAALERATRQLVGADRDAARDLHRDLLASAPTAAAAVETALEDLAARRAGVPFAQRLVDGPAATRVAVSALVAGDDLPATRAAAEGDVQAGFGTLKFKLGHRPLEQDRALLAAVREAVGPDVRLRGDANGAWSEAEALRALEALAPLGLELVEQPVDAGSLDALARVRRASPIPVAADESLRSAADARRLLDAGAADVLVLKPAWLGGPREAMRVARAARDAGVEVLVTSALDAAIGRAMALHVAAALDGPHAAGLATGRLLEHDVASLPDARDGWMSLEGAGLGVSP